MKEKLSIEQSIARIEEIVGLLGDSSVTLDSSLQLYSEGMKLSKQCLEEINAAEQVVEQHATQEHTAKEA
ncbi:MAG: exodeoxyribonuclease VII small subunit [Angelakisella sp.]